MAYNGKPYTTDRKRRQAFKTYNSKINTILRLTNALERDINKITGNTERNQQIDNTLNINSQLELISNSLLDMRDKLEKHNTDQQIRAQNHFTLNPNFNYNLNSAYA